MLAWAGMPLATAEVAAVLDRPIPDVREQLSHTAHFDPVGGDGTGRSADAGRRAEAQRAAR